MAVKTERFVFFGVLSVSCYGLVVSNIAKWLARKSHDETCSKSRRLCRWRQHWRVCYTYCACSGFVRIDPIRFLAGYCKRRLNQALSVLSLSLGFLWLCVVLLTRATFCVVLFFCYLCVLCLARLSVPVQVIDWKDSSPKWPVMCWWGC